MQQPYRGVLRRSDGAFIAAIMVHGEVVGCSSFAFETPEAAAHHYDALALARYGPGLAITNYDEWGRRVYTPPTTDAELELRAWRQSRGNLPPSRSLGRPTWARAPPPSSQRTCTARCASVSSSSSSGSGSRGASAAQAPAPRRRRRRATATARTSQRRARARARVREREEEEEPEPKPAPKRGKKAIPKAPAKPKAKRVKKVPFVGVTQITSGRFQARIRVDKDSTNSLQLGSFEKAEDAARLYDEMARKYRGPGALLNFPTEEDLDKGYRKFEL